MSKDPAFLFYPGDYLKDTQCLSEKSQVAYDRIMCEHMRNICTDMSKIYISYEQHTFFTRRLNDDEKTELDFVLKKLPDGVQIEWVANSMAERKAYTESRSKNRTSKKPKKEQNISSTYVKHMVNEDVNENDIENKDKGKGVGKPLRWEDDLIYPFDSDLFKTNWKAHREMREAKHKKYLTRDSEQASLMAISRLTKNETVAIQIIQQSLANGWQDFFKLKTDGKQQTAKDADERNRNREAELADLMAEKFGTQNN